MNIWVRVLLEVFLFLMIFISGILLIGEKKWILIKFFCCLMLVVRLVIGSVEVLDFRIVLGLMMFLILLNILCLSFWFLKIVLIMKLMFLKLVVLVVGVMCVSRVLLCFCVVWFCFSVLVFSFLE